MLWLTKSKLISLSAILMLLIAVLCLPASAEIEENLLKTIKLSDTPLDFEVSYNGKQIYVLSKEHSLLIYSNDGAFQDEFKVSPGVRQIKISPRGDLLYLLDPTEKTVQTLNLTYVYDININGSPFKGPADASVTMVVFSDFQCPYCAKIGGVIDQAIQPYSDKIKVVFKNFPLPDHPYAAKAAVAAMAADEQGKFWEFHDLIFANFDKLSDQKIEEFAAALMLDKPLFDRSRLSSTTQARVIADKTEGLRVGVPGTPSVFVNGRMVHQANFAGIRNEVEKALRR